ncbi:MAG: universal stress protein [Hyphomicrobiales bacterium]|nr:universal stress protein [Hyphomicrobiales bacterium]
MYKIILVPVEFSHEHSGINAIRIAKKLVDDGGEIVLVNVVGDIPTYIEVELPMDLLNNSKKLALEKLTEIAAKEGIKSDVKIRTGHPANEILAAAESCNADLIIVASHRPGLSDYFLGSTAARIVRHAQCPVFVDR